VPRWPTRATDGDGCNLDIGGQANAHHPPPHRADIDRPLFDGGHALWAIVSLGRVFATRSIIVIRRHLADPQRRAPVSLLWPMAVLGCWLTLRAWRAAAPCCPSATVASPVAVGTLAWPAYDLAALFLSSGEELPDVSYQWLPHAIEYSVLYVCCVAAAVGAIAYRQWSVERTANSCRRRQLSNACGHYADQSPFLVQL
jgi:hypothetical protein